MKNAYDIVPASFDGLRAAITGGTSGLGLALVGELFARHARVAFVARGREGVERTNRGQPRAHGIVGDVSRKEDIHPIRKAHLRGSRVIAIGTTVVRAIEAAAAFDGEVRAGEGLATQRIGSTSRLRVVDAMLSGTHEPGASHYELLGAFTDAKTLFVVNEELNAHDYRTHEFGDSVFIAVSARSR